MSDPIRLLVADAASGLFLERVRKSPAAASFRIFAPETDVEDDLLSVAPEADAIICYKADLPGSVIRAATSLKFIQKHGLNVKNIDVEAATERGVPVATQLLMRNATVA
jgi:phosphoglycerate dehydrogenase-like enzyme